MIIKVCGLKNRIQIEQLDQIHSIDWLGSIFYEKSKRYASKVVGNISNSKRVGVFVNETVENVLKIILDNELDIVQLHGNESPMDCFKLKEKTTVVKTFGIDDSFDFKQLEAYKDRVDYFLFDTKTSDYGGSGKSFNWAVLQKYTMKTPFLLSGGINTESVNAIKSIHHPMFAGVDLNSGFENAPGDKNVQLIQQFITELIDK